MRGRIALLASSLKEGVDPNQILVRLALRKALAGCATVLDIGCGVSATMRRLGVPHSVGVEAYPPSLEQAARLQTHDELVSCDIRDLSTRFKSKTFDACVALDVIEHLEKPDGLKLIDDMERIARKRAVIFTPSGFLRQGHTTQSDLQEHLSGWEPAEMKTKGYRVMGLLGPKQLRGEYHALKYRPALFWGIISLVAQVAWTRHHPEQAAAILCVKTLETGA
jgi:SAM-dependent methyltransferase